MKKNLFIRILALISAAALVSVITACAGDTQGKTTSGSASVTNTSESTASSSQTSETTKATTATQATECRHEYGEWTVIKESTCAEQGSKTRSCLKCGGGKITVILPPVAHKYEEKIIPPTKSEDGCTRYTCGECGKSYEQDVVPAIGSQGLEYALIDGTENYAVVGIGTCTDTEIVIPQLYKGFPVTSVRSRAFENQTQITSVILPKTMVTVQKRAFQGCTGLTEFSFPKSMGYFGDFIFAGCDNLTKIYFRSQASPYYISEYWMSGADALKTIVFDSAYVHRGIVQPDDIVEELIFTENVHRIKNDAFVDCVNIKKISFSDGIAIIDQYAFFRCTNLEGSIYLPGTLLSVGSYSFSDCGITSFVISKGIKGLGSSVIARLHELERIYFTGTEEEWNDINIGRYNQDILEVPRFYYSETEPTAEGNFWRYVDGIPTEW